MVTRKSLTTLVALAAIVAVGGMSSAHAQNLVSNPSFENPGGNGVNPANWLTITNSYGSWNGITAKDGSWVLHSGAGFGFGGRYQDLTTVPGQPYELSFWSVGFNTGAATQQGIVQVGTPGTNNNDLSLNNNAEYVNDQYSVPLYASASDWTQFTHPFTPTTATTRLSFQNVFLGSGQSAVNVDLVSVTLIPEPSTFILAALGALGAGFFCRRRRFRL